MKSNRLFGLISHYDCRILSHVLWSDKHYQISGIKFCALVTFYKELRRLLFVASKVLVSWYLSVTDLAASNRIDFFFPFLCFIYFYFCRRPFVYMLFHYTLCVCVFCLWLVFVSAQQIALETCLKVGWVPRPCLLPIHPKPNLCV